LLWGYAVAKVAFQERARLLSQNVANRQTIQTSVGRAGKLPEVALKLLNARSITVHGNGVTLYLSGGVLGPVVGYGFHGDVRSVER